MSSFPDEASTNLPHPRPVPLGRLLVERGLLSEQQLVEALLEQNRTGDRLGQVLIRLGFVEAPTVAMALATQHGGPLKTEYGFATGFPGEPTEPGAEPSETPEPTTSAAPAPELHLAEAADPEPSEPEPEPEEPEKIAEPPTEEQGVAPAPPTEDRASSQIAAALTGLHAIQAELEAADTRIADLERELAAAQEKLDADHGRVAELEEELEATRERLDGQRSRTAELEERVAGNRVAAETAIAALRELTEASS